MEHLNTESEHLNIWIFKHWNIWIFEHNLCTFQHLKIWIFESLNIWIFEHLNTWTFEHLTEHRRKGFLCSQNTATDPSHRDAAQIRRKLEKFGLFMWISAYLCTQESYKIEPNAAGEQREPSIFGRCYPKTPPVSYQTTVYIELRQSTQKLPFILGSK